MIWPRRYSLRSLVCLMFLAACLCRLGLWAFGPPEVVKEVLRRLPAVAFGSAPASVHASLGIEREPDFETISDLDADPGGPTHWLYESWTLADDYELIVFYGWESPDKLGFLSAIVIEKNGGAIGVVSQGIPDDMKQPTTATIQPAPATSFPRTVGAGN